MSLFEGLWQRISLVSEFPHKRKGEGVRTPPFSRVFFSLLLTIDRRGSEGGRGTSLGLFTRRAAVVSVAKGITVKHVGNEFADEDENTEHTYTHRRRAGERDRETQSTTV